MARTCIFCLLEKEENQFRPEHTFPEAIGGVLTIDLVCLDCNQNLGSKVDGQLTNNLFIQMERLQHKLGGKDGKVPNPFKEGVLEADPKQRTQYRFSKAGDPQDVRLVPNYQEEKLPNGGEVIRVSGDQAEAKQLWEGLNKKLKRKGRPPIPWEVFEREAQRGSSHEPIQLNAVFEFNAIQRALIKIAYELAHKWLGESYRQDGVGNQIRIHLRDYEPGWESRRGFDVDFSIGKAPEAVRHWEGDSESHLGVLFKSPDLICVYVRVFKIYYLGLVVSRTPGQYQVGNHFLANNFKTGLLRESGYEEELARLIREGNRP